MAYNMREATKVLYGLKKKLGRPILAVIDNGVTHNHSTGSVTQDYNTVSLKKVIVLTERDVRDFTYDLAYISSNRNFTSGGLYERGSRLLIIDVKENYTPALNHHYEFEEDKWKISEIDTIQTNRGFLVRVVKIEGNMPIGGSL